MEYAYATCLLNESGAEINETNLTAVLEAADCEVQESRVKALVAALEDIEIDSAVDFDDLGADPAQNGEPTTAEPAESDLTEASGMDLIPAEEVDDTGGSNGEFDETAGAAATDLDETFEEFDGDSAGGDSDSDGDSAGGNSDSEGDSAGANSDSDDQSAGGNSDSDGGSDESVAVPVDEYAEMAASGTDTETESESDEV